MATDRIIRYVYYGVIALLAIVALYKIFNATEDNPNVDLSLWQGIIYTLVAVGVTLFFALIGLVLNFKSNIKPLIFVGVLAGAYLIFKGMASKEVPQKMLDEGITSGVLSSSEAGVMLSIFLMLAALTISVIAGVRGFLK